MKNVVRTYCLLIGLLFVVCLSPVTGMNSASNSDVEAVDKQLSNEQTKMEPQASAGEITEAAITLQPDSAKTDTVQPDTAKTDSMKVYKPNPQKAVWYSALCPGLGQLYNRRYWKLPMVGAAVVGVAYAIGWNQKYYNAYTNAYRDISDDDPNTDSYLNLLPPATTNINMTHLKEVLRNRQQSFRRNRDLSYIGAVGVYLICMIDAYVDAQLYDFDISPDLTLLPPSLTPSPGRLKGVELNLAFRF